MSNSASNGPHRWSKHHTVTPTHGGLSLGLKARTLNTVNRDSNLPPTSLLFPFIAISFSLLSLLWCVALVLHVVLHVNKLL